MRYDEVVPTEPGPAPTVRPAIRPAVPAGVISAPWVEMSGVRVTHLAAAGFSAVLRARTTGSDGPALAVGSVNLDHLYHFGRRRSGGRPLNDGAGDRGFDDGGLPWLLLADGAPISRQAGRVARRPWPRLTGADLLPAVLGAAEDDGTRVGFLGGTAETARTLQTVLPRRWPGLPVSGFWNPPRPDLLDAGRSRTIAADIAAAGTDLLVVGLGKPLQERWIVEHGEATRASVLLAFGAAADFLAGSARRAPAWMRASGCEWLYRLGCEPRRLGRRYLLQGPVAARALLTDTPVLGPADR